MAKNRRKNKIIASNSNSVSLEKQAVIQGGLTARNSLDMALRLSDWDCMNYNQSLSSVNGYNNISLEILSLQQILLTYLYKTFGILAKIVDIPVDEAYKDGGFDLDADTIDENEINELEKVVRKDIDEIKTARKWARLFGGGALVALDETNDLSQPLDLNELEGKELEFIAVDRWQMVYSEGNINLPNGTWGLVQYQKSNANNMTNIHPSRVFVLKGKKAPFLISQQVQGWGISVYEQIFQDMAQFFQSSQCFV